MRRRSLLALPVLATPAIANAQANWPSRPITLIGGFPNGSGVDIYQRRLAEPLSRALGQPIVVDNRTGAGGNIGSDHVAKARPDGYTFYFGTAGTHAINASLYRTLPFDVVRDFTPIAHLGDVPNLMLVSAERRPQFTDCGTVLAAARANPSRLNFSSTGNGASTHLAGAQFNAAAGVDITHVPFRGQPGAALALLSGDVDLFFNQSGPGIGMVRQGQARALAVTTAERLPSLPDVPTVAEACNLPGFVSTTWYGLFGPANLPAPILERMSAEVTRIVQAPEFRTWLMETQGITPPTVFTPAEFAAIQRQDIARWAEVVRVSGARVD
ncbi:Bug family tripartite tricarboxylate transporter substrate binding protein [Roseococcus suduntuyensis]|uniref:Tripartite-type tricarboxylate transporter receptor subunit TctC n=1 Tax=Roseococcus suduntuyensis TaxID=455361 RepID=A0A840AD46_9PROT|nr:tripartite tricarboxylate transporter substrate binding protein [Roseococcus suduntuyensis]MBB3899007.1 tripartite-type tricarboxylate transporter receptor subunit TctC [Roseococcus suduntuyensis]